MGSIFGIDIGSISLIITVTFIVLTLFGAFKGMRRGIARQTVRTITIAISAIISYVVSTSFYKSVIAMLEGKTVGELLTELGVSAKGPEDSAWIDIASVFSTESIQGFTFILFTVLLIPLIFTIGFVIISAIGEIVHIIISAFLGFKKSKNNRKTRLLGTALGALQGALVAAILIFPIANAASTMTGLEAEGEDTATVVYLADEVASNPIASLTIKVGGDSLARSFCVEKIDGTEYDARDAARLFADVYFDIEELGDVSFATPTPRQRTIINEIEKKLFSDAFVKNLVSGILSEIATAVDNGELTVDVEEPYNEMLRTTLAIFKDSSSQNIEPDMQTILNVYFILAEGGVLNAADGGSDEMLDAFITDNGEGTVISRVISELSKNERTKPIVTMLTKLSLSIMAEDLGLDESVDTVYEAVVEGLDLIESIDTTLPEDEYTGAVADVIQHVLASDGIEIELEREIVEEMAQLVYDEYRGVELTEENINEIILYYYEAYAKNL